MSNPFSKDWQPSEALAKGLAEDRRASKISSIRSGQRKKLLQSDDPTTRRVASGTMKPLSNRSKK